MGIEKLQNAYNFVYLGLSSKEAGRRQTFDLVSYLRVERLRWVGHVLRMDNSRYVKQALVSLFTRSNTEGVSVPGFLLMDAPKCDSFSELECLAGTHGDHPEWNELARALSRKITRTRH